MPPLLRPGRSFVTQAVQALVRTFPSIPVIIRRRREVYDTQGDMQVDETAPIVYQGEALYAPNAGVIQLEGYGAVYQTGPALLVAGSWGFQQGDILRVHGRLYYVEHPPDPWHAFSVLKIKQIEHNA